MFHLSDGSRTQPVGSEVSRGMPREFGQVKAVLVFYAALASFVGVADVDLPPSTFEILLLFFLGMFLLCS